jgi:hypothetical protein
MTLGQNLWTERMFSTMPIHILKKLERLEQEEENSRNQMESEPLDTDEESSELSEDLLEEHRNFNLYSQSSI